jgi:hypothetical protein
VVISSPGHLQKVPHGMLEQFHGMEWCLPATTEEEIRTLHTLVFPTLDEEEMELRMQLWGPNPRLVLEYDTTELQDAAFNSLNELTPAAIEEAADTALTGRYSGICHQLLVEHCEGESPESGLKLSDRAYYYSGVKSFASLPLAHWVTKRFNDDSARQFQVLIDASAGINPRTATGGVTYL